MALIAAGAGTLIARWRRKDPAELERLRRLDVNRRGRITAGWMMDLIETVAGGSPAHLVVYKYEVAGVTYEVAQDITALAGVFSAAPSLAGMIVSVKFDPKKPANSIIACEEWCGLPDGEPSDRAASEGLATSTES